MKKSFKTRVCKAMTTIACAALIVAGAFGINSISAKAATVKNYTVDLSNGRIIKFNSEAGYYRKGYSKDYIDAIVASMVMASYDNNFGNADTYTRAITSVLSSNPYQAISLAVDMDANITLHALDGSVGTGKYVLSKESLMNYAQYKNDPDEASAMLYILDKIIENDMDGLTITEPWSQPEIVYNVEIKYSNDPVITNSAPGVATTVAFEVGKEIESNGIKYRITDAAGNLSAIGLTSAPKTVTIPDSVAVAGCNLNVTDIAANFMRGNTKTKKVTIGANVTSIGNQAFYKCKKLKKVTIKSTKIKSFAKKAFGKNAKGFSLKVPKSCKKAYKRLLKKAKIKI